MVSFPVLLENLSVLQSPKVTEAPQEWSVEGRGKKSGSVFSHPWPLCIEEKNAIANKRF